MAATISKRCLLIVLALLMVSCESIDMGDCFKNTGELVSEEFSFEGITTIRLHDNIDLYIYPDTSQRLILKAGSNLMDKIEAKKTDTVLTLRNNNNCNWVRSFNHPVEAHLYTDNLKTLFYYGFGLIESNGIIVSETSFHLNVHKGYGEIRLHVECKHFRMHYDTGGAKVTLTGEADYFGLVSGSTAPVRAEEFQARHVYVNHFGIADFWVNAQKVLDVELHSAGNVVFVGEPEVTILDKTGSGEVIPAQW